MPAWAQVKSHLIKWPLLILLVSNFFLRDLVGGRFFPGKTILLVCFLEVVAALRTLPSPRNAEQVTVADTALSWRESSPGRMSLAKRSFQPCLVILSDNLKTIERHYVQICK